MADISSLGNLQSSEPVEVPTYSPSTAKPFPPAGRYTARVRESFPAEAFGASKAGYLTIKVDPVIVGGEYDGYVLKNTSLSTKPWEDRQTGKATSQFARFLSACGVEGKVGGSPQEQADAAERTASTLIQIDVDWEARNRDANFEVKGMKNFPKNPDGTHSRSVVVLDSDGTPQRDGNGEPVTARAFAVVTRFHRASN